MLEPFLINVCEILFGVFDYAIVDVVFDAVSIIITDLIDHVVKLFFGMHPFVSAGIFKIKYVPARTLHIVIASILFDAIHPSVHVIETGIHFIEPFVSSCIGLASEPFRKSRNWVPWELRELDDDNT